MNLGSMGLGLRQVGGGFSPSKLSGAALWLRSDLGLTLNGSNEVTAWADQSGAGDSNRNFSPPGTDKPSWNSSDASYNNQPTIGTFNKAGLAADCRLRSAGAWSATYTSFTTIIVGHATGAGVNRYFMHESNTDYLSTTQTPGGNVRIYSGTAATVINTTVSAATPRVMIVEWNGASSSVWVDSFTTATATGTLDATSSIGNAQLYLGSYPSTATTYGVDAIAEVYVDTRLFSAWPVGDIRLMGAYLNTRYGKSITLP